MTTKARQIFCNFVNFSWTVVSKTGSVRGSPNGTIGRSNGIIGRPSGVNGNILMHPTCFFYILNFYVYILVFILFANIILVKTVLICEIYKFKV